MTASHAAQKSPSPSSRPSFSELVALRTQWRAFHEIQDRESAESVFRTAGVGLVTDLDLKFLPHVFRSKLNEFGRDWERALAAQALREGYSFYRAQMRIGIDEVNGLQPVLDRSFANLGAPLFFESNGVNAVHDGIWECLFYFTMKADVSPASLHLDDLPGLSSTPHVLRIA